MILVNAANGQQGKLLVPKLLAQGHELRACVRSERSAAELRDAGLADVVVGDISQPDIIERAIRGVDKVYHVCPGINPREREIGLAWIDAAKAEGVEHFVFSSVLHAILTDLVQHEIKRDIEEYLVSSGLEYTILQPTIYMAPRRFTRIFETGVLRAGWSLDRHQSLVDIGDVTDVAAAVLGDSERHAGATYELVGAGRYTAHDMGAIIAKVFGKPITVEEIGPDAYLKGLFGDHDLSTMPHEAAVGRSLTERYSSHDFIGNPNVLTWLLGRPPTSFEQFVASHHAAMTAAASG
ncbi:SDR family oxidoreductase [Sphingomonas bacterium]|uniref:SDR family oxidoreductase n=1 Tax=Sphingomonas bacterium TaxID=1895847 RepID=UPI0015771B36|nr:NmrA family NAD(P)-binding protein [Sphingomonas bacterium]